MKVPRDVSGRACVKALRRLGFEVHHQVGSHLVLRRPDGTGRVVVPMHDALDVGTLLSIVEQSGVPRKEFLKAL